jgi:hypothetical protein
LFAPVTPEKLASQELDASVGASGPHVFAVRVSAIRQRRIRVHRIPRSTSVTIAKRPSRGGGTAADIKVIWAGQEPEYFFKRDWTASISLIRLDKLAFWRKTPAPAMARQASDPIQACFQPLAA